MFNLDETQNRNIPDVQTPSSGAHPSTVSPPLIKEQPKIGKFCVKIGFILLIICTLIGLSIMGIMIALLSSSESAHSKVEKTKKLGRLKIYHNITHFIAFY